MKDKLSKNEAEKRYPHPPFIICLLLLFTLIVPVSSNALEIGFKYVNSGSDTIITELSIIDSLSEKLIEYIDKGVPVGFEYRVELWKVRQGWFDKQITINEIKFRIRFDTWSKKYTVLEISPDLVVENTLTRKREMLDLILSSDRIFLPFNDSTGVYYLVGKIVIKVMTLSNFREVESWLKGEISGIEKPNIRKAPDKISEFLFNTALKVTGLENVSKDIKTGIFELNDLPLKLNTEPE
ncbi:MAG: DUF4390 domain-containing protein [candidate division Zixibacteria bacterium]